MKHWILDKLYNIVCRKDWPRILFWFDVLVFIPATLLITSLIMRGCRV